MKTIEDSDLPILIVDDSAQYATVLAKMLSNAFGYSNITRVESPNEALGLLQEEGAPYRLIFVDYHYPCGTTGGALLHQLKNEGLIEGRIFFLITSEPTVDNINEATSAGALGVVAKPFSRAELGRQLEKAENLLRTENMEGF